MSTVARCAAGLAVAAATFLSPAPLDAQQPHTEWTTSAGRATVTFRDVSRTSRPVDASPIAWEGSGPALRVRFDRTSRASVHRVDVTWITAGGFSYTSPLRRAGAPPGDSASQLATRYEYRRYFFRDVGVRGLDAGASGEAGFVHAARERGYAAFVLHERSNTAIFGGAIGARFTRWPRATIEASWTNGLRLSHRHDTFDSGGPAGRVAGGGGWYDEWLTTGRVRITAHMAVFVEHAATGDVLYAEHAANTGRVRTLVAGVTYAR